MKAIVLLVFTLVVVAILGTVARKATTATQHYVTAIAEAMPK